MTRLSVNINKIATLRNSRGGNIPNVVQAAINCERYGAEGITVHPRPDERHIRYQDVRDLKPVLTTEFNIEGNPNENFIRLVLEAMPAQVTLVPDAHDAITSNQGWDTIKHESYLKDVISRFQEKGIRVSVFVDADPRKAEHAAVCGADRVELYTEPYAAEYHLDREKAVKPFIEAGKAAKQAGLGLNAGHDLNLDNLNYFIQQVENVDEVSIGHALIADALYYGLENTIQLYLRQLHK